MPIFIVQDPFFDLADKISAFPSCEPPFYRAWCLLEYSISNRGCHRAPDKNNISCKNILPYDAKNTTQQTQFVPFCALCAIKYKKVLFIFTLYAPCRLLLTHNRAFSHGQRAPTVVLGVILSACTIFVKKGGSPACTCIFPSGNIFFIRISGLMILMAFWRCGKRIPGGYAKPTFPM